MPNALHPHDRLLARTVLRLFPASVTPNQLTLFRFVATPFVLVLLHTGHLPAALFAFLLVASTDALDGSMARTRDQVTDWGKLWDPVADKVLIASVAALLILDHFPLSLAILIFLTEGAFLLGGYLRKRKGIIVSANGWGKLKMLFQVLGTTLFLVGLMTASTGIEYAAYAAFIVSTLFALVSLYRHGL